MRGDLDDDLRLALELAEVAERVALPRFRAHDLVVTTKPDRTPVTDADRAVEQAMRAVLAERRPGDSVLGEEFGGGAAPGRQWIVDPIDGTANFLRGLPIWATLIALAVDGEPVLGVAAAPALGRRWWAARGSGAWAADGAAAPTRLGVSGVGRMADAVLSYNSLQQWDGAGELEPLLALARASWRTRALGDFWSYVLLAEGRLDVAGEHDLQVYDLAALVPIVVEAGGRLTSAHGDPGPWHGSALATNGRLHEEALELLRSARHA